MRSIVAAFKAVFVLLAILVCMALAPIMVPLIVVGGILWFLYLMFRFQPQG